jgi:SpoVK/Ycf46/Vps4 family AAA+-type ATPase
VSVSKKPSKELDAVFIVIDEIDALGSAGSASPQSDLQMAVRLALANWMDVLGREPAASESYHSRMSGSRTEGKYCFCVVATSNRPEAVDPQFRRGGRLDLEIAVTNSPAEREQLLRTYFETAMKGRIPSLNNTISSTSPLQPPPATNPVVAAEMIESMALMTGGYVAADLFALVREMMLRFPHHDNNESTENSNPLIQSFDWREAFLGAGKVVPPSCLRGVSVKIPHTRFKDIIGHEEVKRQLRRLVSVFSPALREKVKLFHLKYPGGVLLHGPPGNAKTQLAMAAVSFTLNMYVCTYVCLCLYIASEL